MVGVREPVRARARRGHDGALLEREHRVARARGGEHVRDRLARPSRTRRRAARGRERAVAPSRAATARNSAPSSDAVADLEVRRARAAERAAAEERAAQVRRAAARSPTTRRGGRSSGARRSVEDARLVRAPGARAVVPGDVQLVARRAVERAAAVGADLGRHAERAQQAKARRATAELARSRCTATSPRPSRCTLPAEWKSPTAPRAGRSRASARSRASSLRSSSESDTLELQQPPLVLDAERSVRADAAGGDDAVARHDEREPVLGAERARGALRRAGGRRAPRARRR